MIEYLDIADLGDGPRVRFRPQAGYAQWVRLIVDGVFQGPYVYADDDRVTELTGLWMRSSGDHLVSVQLNGDDSSTECPYQQQHFQDDRADRLNVQVTASPTVTSYGDSSQFSSWSLSGLERFTTVSPVDLHPNWGRLELYLDNEGGDYTVTLKLAGRTVASGTRTGNGSVTLAEQNSSGVSGSVTVTYSAEITSGAYVITRWPSYIKIHYRTSSFGGGDFPRTAEATLKDDGKSSVRTYRSGQLSSGTYYVVAHQMDENGNESTGTAGGGDTVTLVAPPEPPTDLEYASGGYAATVIQWTASATGGATYKIYDSEDDDQINLSTETSTQTSGTGTIQKTLGAVASDYTGTRRVIVRSVSGGVTEGNATILEIEYDDGSVVAARPPAPEGLDNITLDGRKITIPVRINKDMKSGTPTVLKLYVAEDGSAMDYGSADASVNLGSAVAGVISTDSSGDSLVIEHTHGSNKTVTYELRCETAGGVASASSPTYGPVVLTTTAPGDPTQSVGKGV